MSKGLELEATYLPIDRLRIGLNAAYTDSRLTAPEEGIAAARLGNTPRWETIEQFTATVKRDRAKWAEVVKAVGAKVD